MLSAFKSVLVLISTYGHESWVMYKRLVSHSLVQWQRYDSHEEFMEHYVVKCADVQFIKPWMSSAVIVWPHEQNAPRKLGKTSFWLPFLEKWPRGRLRVRWHDYISNLAWSPLSVKPAERAKVAENQDLFQVLQRLLPLWPSHKIMQVWKLTKKQSFRNRVYLSLKANFIQFCKLNYAIAVGLPFKSTCQLGNDLLQN